MRISFFSSIVLCVFAVLAVMSLLPGSFQSYGIEPSVHQGSILVGGNDVMVIEGPFSINGSIVIVGNATLIVRNADVNFLQKKSQQWNITLRDPKGGRPRLSVENAMIRSDYLLGLVLYGNSSASISGLLSPKTPVSLYGDSSTVIDNSTLHYFYSNEQSSADITDSIVSNGYTRGTAKATYAHCALDAFWCEGGSAEFVGCEVDYVGLQIVSANVTIRGLKGGHISYFEPRTNTSLQIAPGGSVPDLVLRDTEILSWVFHTYETTNLTISDSELGGLLAMEQTTATISNCSSDVSNHVDIRHESTAYVFSSTFDRATARHTSTIWLVDSLCSVYEPLDQGRICAPAWVLEVHVQDSQGRDVPNAVIRAVSSLDPNLSPQQTDGSGRARLILAEVIRDINGSKPVGMYEVTAQYGVYTSRSSLEMKNHATLDFKLEGLVIGELDSVPVVLCLTVMLPVLYLTKGRGYGAEVGMAECAATLQT